MWPLFPSLFARTAPDGPQEAPILYSSSTGSSFCPLAAGEGRSLRFHKQLNAGALSGAFLLSRLSFLRRMCRASFNLGINLTKVQNLLLCLENALHAVVDLSSSHPPSLFHPNLWSLKRLKMLLRPGIVLGRQLLMS